MKKTMLPALICAWHCWLPVRAARKHRRKKRPPRRQQLLPKPLPLPKQQLPPPKLHRLPRLRLTMTMTVPSLPLTTIPMATVKANTSRID